MNGQTIIILQVVPASLHIIGVYDGMKISVSAPDKYISEKCFLHSFPQQINSGRISACIYLLYAEVQPALSIFCFQLYKPHILSFFFSFIFIHIGNQSPIIRHIFLLSGDPITFCLFFNHGDKFTPLLYNV